MVSRKLLAAQEGRPRVAVAAHDGRTAALNRLTKTPAGGNKPGGGGQGGVTGGAWFYCWVTEEPEALSHRCPVTLKLKLPASGGVVVNEKMILLSCDERSPSLVVQVFTSGLCVSFSIF